MREPTFDRDGYPTDETLDAITKWDVGDLTGLFRFLTAAWSEYGQYTDQLSDSEREVAGVEGEHQLVRLVTGGWSGNESLLAALEQNTVAYWMTWRLSALGGLHIFEVRAWPAPKAEAA